ncbi:MAG: sugar transferase [Bacteroidales bacterium]|nr:sugar transferase [Bacteroidales bacterium]
MKLRTSIQALLDALTLTVVFAFFLLARNEPFLRAVDRYLYSFIGFLFIWVVASLAGNKFKFRPDAKLNEIVWQTVIVNLFIIGVVTMLMYLVRVHYYSRTVVFGTTLVVSFIELSWKVLIYYLQVAIIEPIEEETNKIRQPRHFLREVFSSHKVHLKKEQVKAREDAVLVEINREAFEYIFTFAQIDSPDTLLTSTLSPFNIEMQMQDQFRSIVNLKRINDIRHINQLFEAVNKRLPVGGIFIDYVETKNLRKQRILNKFPPVINYIAYFFDFIIKRLLPRFRMTRGFYFFLTRGQNRVFTKAETYGRLYACGFEVVDEKLIGNHLYFVMQKVSEPHYPENPTYGPFIRLNRIGYHGKMINVYKLRTMHPYSEFIQNYVYSKHGTSNGDKADNDFRVTSWGRIFRALWLDEFPMLINLFRGDIKLVGVRPLSKAKFDMYPEDLQQKRIKFKPGLVPPFYADIPQTFEEHMASENRYLDAYAKAPFRTDFKYFFKALYNILFKKARSK